MEKITLKAYALKHKLSIFNVVKMMKSGQIASETVNENDREVHYILIDETTDNTVEETTVPKYLQKSSSLKAENNRLKKEIIELKAKIAVLQKRV